MYSYTFDEDTGGILLNSTPTNFSKEPRPVYASEMDLLGFSAYWEYEHQNEVPYMWAESNTYWYRGQIIARIKGGDLYHEPILTPVVDEEGKTVFCRESGYVLQQIDIPQMCEQNKELLKIMEKTTAQKVVREYEKYKDKLDIFEVAFSGGKDSAVLLDIIKKALPHDSFVVIFGDTGMEFPDTYKAVEYTQKQCEKEGISFYIARSHFDPEESWKLFGPPSRTLRWCCSVHKSVPQILKLRELTAKANYTGLNFVGIRKHESVTRSLYEYESYGKKQKGQYSFNPLLEWTSAEIWLYIFSNNLYINQAYIKGNSRVGCLMCPMGRGKSDFIKYKSYPIEIEKYNNLIADNIVTENVQSYISGGGWISRRNGRDIKGNVGVYEEKVDGENLVIRMTNPKTDWREWLKTLGSINYPIKVKTEEDKTIVSVPANVANDKICKYFKQVFHKATYCVECGECVANCPNGSISFVGGLHISNCIHCKLCHEIDKGCLAYHSLELPHNGEKKMKSINTFSSHAPKMEWIDEFFKKGDEFFKFNSLGSEQVSFFKTFLTNSNLIINGETTTLFKILQNLGAESNATWGILLTNLTNQNAQIRWYIETMNVNQCYDRSVIENLSINTGNVNPKYTSFIINAFGRLCELPLGTSLNFGFVDRKGKNIVSLTRTRCSIDDNRVILYALYKFVEKCNMDDREFHLSYLFDEEVERDGVSPVRMFGIYDEEEWKSILLGLSARYPEFINATFTNDLKTISLKDKTSADVLELFREEL